MARSTAGRRLALLVALVAILELAVGCGPFVDPESVQNRADAAAGPLGNSSVVGETFVATCDALSSIEVQIAGYPDVKARRGQLRLTVDELSLSPTATLASVAYAERDLTANQWITIAFAPVTGSRGLTFRVSATSTAPATAPFTLWASSHVEDPGVQRFENGNPQSGALTLRTSCDSSPLDVARMTLAKLVGDRWLWPIVLVLCLLPGVGVAIWLDAAAGDVCALLGTAAGWSILLAPIALVAASTVGLGHVAGLLLLVAGAVMIGWHWWRRKGPLAADRLAPRDGFQIRQTGPEVVGGVGLLAAVVVRTANARDLVLPMWVDSTQHSYIARLIVDRGAVPTTYGTAMPNEPFDYHFGFHAIAAAAAELSGRGAASSVLATGQVLGFLMPLAVYLLALELCDSRRAAAVAALLVGAVTTMPTYYVTWGRYPELAGLVALPAGFAAVRRAFDRRPSWGTLGPAVTASVAMPLVHPRVAIFWAALIVAYLAATSAHQWRKALQRAARLVAIGAIAAVLISPWILRQWAAHRAQLAIVGSFAPIDFPLGFVTAGDDRYVLGLALLGLVIAAIQRLDLLALFAVWAALVLVSANPTTFHLPLYVWVNNDSVAIATFLPAAILAGYALARAAELARFDCWRRSGRFLAGAACVAVALSQTPSLLAVVNPCCYIGKAADLAAIEWIGQNTPGDSRFIVNGYRWSGSTWAGSDAGYWLPVLANRATIVPPLFYAAGPPNDARQVDRVATEAEASGADPARLDLLARQIGAGYVYVGTQGGPIDPFALAGNARFRVVYRRGGAWVFEVGGGGGDSRTTTTATTPDDSDRPSNVKAAGLKSATSG
jgi:hypothetical protein